MIRIFLMGYMGAGKTTLGKAFAKELGVEFIDLDWFIEGRFQRSISQIFTERGEEGFRQIEHNMLHEVAEFEDVIISTGGGTPCFFDNIDYMRAQGITVYLKASDDSLFNRLSLSRAQRPILAHKTDEELRSFIEEAVAQREPFYTRAEYTFDSSQLESVKQIAESVAALKALLNID